MNQRIENALEEIDAAMFSGDVFHDDNNRATLAYYIGRWTRNIAAIEKPEIQTTRTQYRCVFTFSKLGTPIQCQFILPLPYGIGDVKDGFWVDKDYNWCVTSKIKYWIPPHRILFIVKEDV